ncbi:MAG: NAD(P)H-dependent glycerol-3-phosphate dehydrogenase [Planctomycetota bacterium]|nr:NAD(P)H-dependent glycerol-3-phosphate dehydrogenase [Planctomycetota bacterium]
MSDRVVTVIGDGQMGLVMADALQRGGAEVRVWGPFPEDLESLANTRRSSRLKGFSLDPAIVVEPDAEAAVAGTSLLVNAIPTQFIRTVWARLGTGTQGIPVVSVAKGIENETLLRPTEIITATIESLGVKAGPQAALSGPTIANELINHLPAAMVAASLDKTLSERIQAWLMVPWLRIYTHDDLVGVELAGATKNVIALAAGMVDGLGAGDNAKSAVLARGLSEITALGEALGARLETFFGVAGVGDLATTCFSPHGRNRTCGEAIGRGMTLEAFLESSGSVIEGVATTRSIVMLADQHKVEMPITRAVHAILFEDLSVSDAIRHLMQRDPKAESSGS